MINHVKCLSLVSAFFLAVLMSLHAPPVSAAAPSYKIAPIDSTPHGRTYAEWSVAWQQWALSIPVSAHPLFDTGPADTGQSGPVFFLGGKFCRSDNTNCGADSVVRRVTVPAGKALYFPVFNAENSSIESGHGDINSADTVKDINVLRKWNEDAANTAIKDKLYLEIDGHRVDIASQRVQSDVFGFYIPADNIFTAIGEGNFSEGFYFPGVDEGYYVMLQPFPPGKEHKIHIHMDNKTWNWLMDITYYVTWQK